MRSLHIVSIRTQLGIYETESFERIKTLFADDIRMVLESLEFDVETNRCYVLGFMRDDENVFDYGFVAIFDSEEHIIHNIHAIDKKSTIICGAISNGNRRGLQKNRSNGVP